MGNDFNFSGLNLPLLAVFLFCHSRVGGNPAFYGDAPWIPVSPEWGEDDAFNCSLKTVAIQKPLFPKSFCL